MTLDFWFDFASTYSYLAAMTIERRAKAAGVDVRWRPFLLGPIFQKIHGVADSPFNLQPARGRYMWRDLERLCADEALAFKRPSVFPRNSTQAARLALLGLEQSWGVEFSKRVFAHNFAHDRDIADETVLRSTLDELGVDSARAFAEASDADHKPRLRAQTEEAERLGVFGAPTFFVKGELFFGSDRLEQALRWAIPRV